MGPALIVILTVLVMTCFYPPLQTVFAERTKYRLSTAAMPWIGLGLAFLLLMRVMPTPIGRGFIFGAALIGIAVTIQFLAPRYPAVKSYIKNAFFSGQDIWEEKNLTGYLGAFWAAGLVLLIPIGGMDMFLNIAALVAAGIWFPYKAWVAKKAKETAETNNSSSAEADPAV